MGIQMINGHKCYVCESAACAQPGGADLKGCSTTNTDGSSGYDFVSSATGKSKTDPYSELASDLKDQLTRTGLNSTLITWTVMTDWVTLFFDTDNQLKGL